ncbi:FXYD domain-containing ion transport regulator 7 isoform X3 [Perognathus longimembris pacificus]|uniref:FXYD domain-containing ion transport regulator 7 isoform X3 n=1 Tax=Perognathus longimembris pacificus TaxID=214514 RepID=UPI00201A092D|nr:FXYD domain-containing ion transport regulator 7 isoform X3 [Perognathus longimembris pacificus]
MTKEEAWRALILESRKLRQGGEQRAPPRGPLSPRTSLEESPAGQLHSCTRIQHLVSFPRLCTVQTVGMTLATVMFLLGIIIIISKKVKCRKADSRSESPTCKSCKSELPSSAPGGGV